MLIRPLVATLAILAVATPASATAQQAQPSTGLDSAVVAAARRGLQSDLRNFVTAQELYFSKNGRYARSMQEISSLYKPSASAAMIVVTSSGTGHSEVAVDNRAPGLVCAMFVGIAPPPFGTGSQGEVSCHGP